MGTAIVQVRKGLIDALDQLPALANTLVTYGYKAGAREREKLWTQAAEFDHEPASLRQPTTYRNEVGRFEVVVLVEGVAQDAYTTAARAAEIGLQVEDFIALHTNWTNLALGVVLNELVVAGSGAMTEAFNDKGSIAELVLPVRYKTRLTT